MKNQSSAEDEGMVFKRTRMKQIQNEEIEILNKANEILKKYLSIGSISQADLDGYEKMILSIIEENTNTEKEQKNDISLKHNKTEKTDIMPEKLFTTEKYLDGIVITKYIGFDDEHIVIPRFIKEKPVVGLELSAFANVDNLISVVIPDGVRIIGRQCFYNCRKLVEIVFPSTLKMIGGEAFGCSGLKEVTIPNSVESIGHGCFRETPLERATLSLSMKEIPDHLFCLCENLRDVIMPNSIEKISYGAFYNCRRLQQVSLPCHLRVIESESFGNCTSLKSIDIPKTVISIGKNAFSESYLVRPDRRYNPWREYRNLNITIHCSPGSEAQQYARENGFRIAQSQKNQ